MLTIQTRILHVQSKRKAQTAQPQMQQTSLPPQAQVYSPSLPAVNTPNTASQQQAMALNKLRENAQLPLRMAMLLSKCQAQGMPLPTEAARRFTSLKGALEKQLELAPLGVVSMNPNALMTLIDQSIRVTVALEQKLTTEAASKTAATTQNHPLIKKELSAGEQRLLKRLEKKPTRLPDYTPIPIEHRLRVTIDLESLGEELEALRAKHPGLSYAMGLTPEGGANLSLTLNDLDLSVCLTPDYPSSTAIPEAPRGMIHTVTSFLQSKLV